MLNQFSHSWMMPAILSPSQSSPLSPPISSPNPPFIPLMMSVGHLYFFAFVIAVSLALFLLLRLLVKPSAPLLPHFPTDKSQPLSLETETLKSIWPPATLIAAAPESKSLPTPTIRRHSYPHMENSPSDPPPGAQISHVQSWPTSGDLVQQETVEKLNGCRRHVVVFGRRKWLRGLWLRVGFKRTVTDGRKGMNDIYPLQQGPITHRISLRLGRESLLRFILIPFKYLLLIKPNRHLNIQIDFFTPSGGGFDSRYRNLQTVLVMNEHIPRPHHPQHTLSV